MKFSAYQSFIFSGLTPAIFLGHVPNMLKVETSSGVLHGTINETAPEVRQFLGVPFAKPPVGDLRWMPPEPLYQPCKEIDATQFSASCPQFEGSGATVYSKDVRELFINGPSGEDCLTLSVYAPTNSTSRSLPVYIWIYGGGFQTGGSSVPYQNPANWVQRTQSHIVVSIQYRLNIFGFPIAAGLEQQNLGLLDQRTAIEWLQANIAQFGGDPTRMVLWGQSAGAVSTDMQNFAFPEDPIVTGFVCDSGSVFTTISSTDYTYSNFSFVANHFNCSSASSKQELACMRNVSVSAIEAFLKSYSDSSASPPLSFQPFVDNEIVFSNYTERYALGHISDRPAIFGSNHDEGTAFAPYPSDPNSASPNETIAFEVTLDLFQCPAYYTAQMRQKLSLTTFQYNYQGNFSNISPHYWMGAYHSSELPLLFGTDGDFRGASTSFEVAVSHKMQDFWLAFLKDPAQGVTKFGGWTEFSKGDAEIFGHSNWTTGQEVVAQLEPYGVFEGPCKDYFTTFQDR